MGCGGSRTDAVDTLDSWTKETESTWLTSTDGDIPLSSIQNLPSEDCEKTISPDFFEDAFPRPAQAYLKVCSSVCEVSLDDVKPRTTPAPTPQEPVLPTSGTTVQRGSVLHTEKITKCQDNRMSAKQVTITVAQSVHRPDNRKVKTSLATYEDMKPVETLKLAPTFNR